MNLYRKVRNLTVDKTVKTAIGAGAIALFFSAIPEFLFALTTLPKERGW